MIGVDTNILLRALLDDDTVQSAKARLLLKSDRIFVPLSVMLELEWALRKVFAKPRKQVRDILSQLLELDGVVIGSSEAIATALEATSKSGDFADFLHRALSKGCDRFASFDKKFVSLAEATAGPAAFEP